MAGLLLATSWRRRVEHRQRFEALKELYDEINKADPCPDPNCMRFRERMLAAAEEDHHHWWSRRKRDPEPK